MKEFDIHAAIAELMDKKRFQSKKSTQPPKPEINPTDVKRKKIAERFEHDQLLLSGALPWIVQPSGKLISDYEISCPEQERAVFVCRRFVLGFMDRYMAGEGSRGIMFAGSCGTGKTHLSCGILEGLRQFKIPGFFMPAIELFDLYTPSYSEQLNTSLAELRKLIASVSCLVLDDVGADAWSPARRSRLQQILDMRREKGVPTIITTNLKPSEAESLAGERLFSRFRESFFPVVCTWPDHRKVKSLWNAGYKEAF